MIKQCNQEFDGLNALGCIIDDQLTSDIGQIEIVQPKQNKDHFPNSKKKVILDDPMQHYQLCDACPNFKIACEC